MIKLSTLSTLAWGLFACGVSMADGESAICTEPILPGLHVVEVRCDVEGGVSAFSLSGPEPTSPYASEFDRRRVVIAKATSKDKLRFYRDLDSDSGSRPLSFAGLRLLSPPAENQIVQRIHLKKSIKKRGWHIATERVSYGAQGGAAGYVMDCSTATRWHKTHALTVAECYPLEERQRFVKTLDLVP